MESSNLHIFLRNPVETLVAETVDKYNSLNVSILSDSLFDIYSDISYYFLDYVWLWRIYTKRFMHKAFRINLLDN